MRYFHSAGLALLLLTICTTAWAVTYQEIPPDVRANLQEGMLEMFDPAVLALLSVEDIREYADANAAGEMRFIAEVRVEEAAGPLDPEMAKLILQIPRGAPFVEGRFLRLASQAYGRGIFSRLEWAVYENLDGSVNIQLWYASRDPSYFAPDITYYSLAGWQLGVRYEDVYVDGENKRLAYGVQFPEDYPDEPKLHFAWSDNTLNGGRNGYSVSTSLRSEWRQRLADSVNQANLRQRIGRVDAAYSWGGRKLVGTPGTVSVGTGYYHQDLFVLAGDPTMGGTLPRSDVNQVGDGYYLSLGWRSNRSDIMFTPRKGHNYSLSAEQHLGDFQFNRVTGDYRRYFPVANILGYESPGGGDGVRHDIREFLPHASVAVQMQVGCAWGDVPYSYEKRFGNSILRGFPADHFVGTKYVGARAEYRCGLNAKSTNELFVFSDHGGLGEEFSDLEGFHTYGLGGVFSIPIYGGIKLGGYYGGSYSGEEDTYGITFGYMF